MRLTSLAPVLLVAALAATTSPTIAHAASTFPQEFAPQDGLVAPVEKPFRDEICLNGSWQFQPIALPATYQKNVSPAPDLPPPANEGWEKMPIRIPSPWNVNAFPDQKGLGGDLRCYPSYPESWNSVQMGWLRRSFKIPAAWKGKRLLIHFSAVAGDTQVLVNGKPVGENHDIFFPFDVDITDAVQWDGQNTLSVGVRKSSLRDMQGKFGRRPYQAGSFWGQHIVGIWQDVFLQAVPSVRITDVFVKPQVAQNKLEADVTLQNDSDKEVTVRLNSTVYPWLSQAGKDTLSAPVPKWKLGAPTTLKIGIVTATVPAHGSVVLPLSGTVNKTLKYWSPESPNLYGLVCRLQEGQGKVLDTKYTRFGWRQLTFEGSKVLLNGSPLIMKGDSWHFMGIPQMTRRYAWAWYKTAKDANLNAIRLHAQPYPSFYLDVADEMGMLILDESAIWASDGGPKTDDPAFWKDSEAHVQRLVLRDRNHPSVFGWSVSNELMAIVRGVFRGSQEQQDQVNEYFGIWANICRKYDPSRIWISADGEDDGHGALPTYVVHYGGTGTMERASKSGKPWGVGEAGPAYYGTPEQIAQQSGNPRSYLSFDDRMEGVASVSYQNLMDQRRYDASYRSVFNLVWYGLKPLELGMADTTRPPTLADGIFFTPFVEGKPGIQPERLGPYSTTLNPGYDKRLPLYAPWPLFTAIRNAQAEPAVAYPTPTTPTSPTKPAAMGAIKSVRVLSGTGGTLAQSLTDLGVTVATTDSNVLFVDGIQPPGTDAKQEIQKTLDNGGTVFVWGANTSSIAALNALLPAPLEVTDRAATSLVPVTATDPLLAGLTPASLYFSELSPSVILPAGLGGPLLSKAKVLLAASNTDWMRWNRQPETTKVAMVLRSERETKPSGTALAEIAQGKGRLFVCNLPAAPPTSLGINLNRQLLANLGLVLNEGVGQRNTLDASGRVTRALAAGLYGMATPEEAQSSSIVAPNSGPTIAAGTVVKDRTWSPLTTDTTGSFDLTPLRKVNPQQSGVLYLSFWLYSPKALDNLLLDPHLPTLDLTITSPGSQVWVNGKAPKLTVQGNMTTAPALPLQQGWNHLLVKVVRAPGDNSTTGPVLKLVSSQADYLPQLRGTQEKP
jgi:hypothetical protein